ncbi:glycosyltransferase [Schlesneria paludicola]|uniref:glycosyltransferase n=1 Tax=Schlesneria paludicola TaxID=360056 RepID=UPI00030B9EC1|nr:glycosyltransferase family 2 protein [Schlesneria paludicola]
MSDTTQAKLPSASIVFLTYNGMPLVEDVLKSIRNQKFNGDYELLCIDTSSKDGTFELSRTLCDEVIQIQPHEFHHSRTRNLGVSVSNNDICVFLSQDALPSDEHWLTNLISPFVDPDVGAVYGRQKAPDHFGAQRRYSMGEVYPEARQVRQFVPGEKRSLSEVRFSDANGAYRRALLLEKPFPEHVPISEDIAACYYILEKGLKVVYEPLANVIHGHERSIKDEFRWAFDSGIALKRLGILGNPNFKSETKYGIKKLTDELVYFTKRFAIGTAMHSVSVYAARWLGVQLGKRENQIPPKIARAISPSLAREHARTKNVAN